MFGGTREVEIAMTHRVGADGRREVCPRPAQVREMAVRLQQWRGVQRETCKSCVSLPAVSVCDGLALCSRCREEMRRRLRLTVPDLPARRRPSLRAEDTGQALVGHAIVLNQPSVDLGGFVEYIRDGALDRTIRERIDLRALWNHDTNLTIGRLSAGTLSIWIDGRGLANDIRPPRWAHGQVESVERRDIQGQSFMFETVTDDWHLQDEQVVREIFDMRIYEVSPVSFPAYPQTDVRAENADARAKEAAREHRLRVMSA